MTTSEENGNSLQWELCSLFHDSMFVWLPQHTEDMSDDFANRVYPYTKKPQVMKCIQDVPLYFTFSIYPQVLANYDVRAAIGNMKSVIERVHPTNIIEKVNVLKYTNNWTGWFSYATHSSDKDFYNVMYVTPVNGQLMFGTGMCLAENNVAKVVIKRVILSIYDERRANNDKSI